MDWTLVFIILVGIVFFVLGAVCVISIILQLPGAWIMIALALVIELIDGLWLPETRTSTFGVWVVSEWWIIVTCLLLAGLGEVLEFFAGVLGAKKGGASKRGMWGSLIGGIAGAIIFTFVLVVIPVIGSLIGAVIGTFVGAVIGELSAPPAEVDGETVIPSMKTDLRGKVRGSLKPATGATIGRILGTLSKLPIGIIIWLALTVAALWP